MLMPAGSKIAGRFEPRGKTKRPALKEPALQIRLLGLDLGLLLASSFGFCVDARRDLRERLETLLGLLAILAVGIQFDGLLIGLDGTWLNDDFHLVALLLVFHRTDQRSAEQIPRLRALWIEFGRLFQRLDGFLHLADVVERDAGIAIGLRGVRRIKLGALLISGHGIVNLAVSTKNSAEVVVVAWRRLERDGLAVCVRCIIGTVRKVVGIAKARPNQVKVLILFRRSGFGGFKFGDGFAGKVGYLCLHRVALIGGSLRHVILRGLRLCQRGDAGVEVRLHASEFLLVFFLLLHLLCRSGALFGQDVLEVGVDVRRFAASNLDLSELVGLVGSRQLNRECVDASAHLVKRIVSVLVGFCGELLALGAVGA